MTDAEVGREQQAQLYGAPLGDLARDVMGALGLTQGRLAEVLGLSAPMLSQLISAKRVKIGNPAVVARLQALLDLARDARSMTADQRQAALVQIQASSPTLSSTRLPDDTRETLVQGLRALASPDQLREAAARLQDIAPLARVLDEAAGGTPGRG